MLFDFFKISDFGGILRSDFGGGGPDFARSQQNGWESSARAFSGVFPSERIIGSKHFLAAPRRTLEENYEKVVFQRLKDVYMLFSGTKKGKT